MAKFRGRRHLGFGRKRIDGITPPVDGEERGQSGGWKPIHFWTLLSVFILVLVLNYDRQGVEEGNRHVTQARKLEGEGRFSQAITEYRVALANPRLSLSRKAEVAVALGDLELRHRNDPTAAADLYNQARHLSYRTAEKLGVLERLKELQRTNPLRNGTNEDGTSATRLSVIIASPSEDAEGPVLARVGNGHELRAGELKRVLRETSRLDSKELREDPAKLDREVERLTLEWSEMAAALDRNSLGDPEFQASLYEVLRAALRARGRELVLRSAQAVTPEDIAATYQKHSARYIRPRTIGLSLIATTTKEAADSALAALRNKAVFADVATSYSVDQFTKSQGGIAGTIEEGYTTVPVVGNSPELAQQLLQLPHGSVTSPEKHGDRWYIFQTRVLSSGSTITLEEARAEILQEIRKSREAALHQRSVRDIPGVSIDNKNVGAFWKWVDRPTTSTITSSGGTSAK